MGDGDGNGIEVVVGDREAAARLQQAARAAGHLLAAVEAGLAWALGHFRGEAPAVVDGEVAFDGEVELDLVTWTRGRILGVAETAMAEAAAELLAEADADPVAALGRYIREDVRGSVGGPGAGPAGRWEGEPSGSGATRSSGPGAAKAEARPGGAGRVFLTTGQAAEVLGLSPRTLESLRVRGGGPPFHKLGRRVVYSREDLKTWTAARRRLSTSDPGEE